MQSTANVNRMRGLYAVLLAPLTRRSRDNLPNPVPQASNPYVPANTPAIGDLFDLFDLFDFRPL